jgi:amphi-Trp domain-containing protein
MSSSPNEVSMKANMGLAQVVEYLETFISSLKQGKVYVEQGDNIIVLSPPDNVDVELEAVEKKGKQKFTLELAWRKKASSTSETGFKISATMPESLAGAEDDVEVDEEASDQLED